MCETIYLVDFRPISILLVFIFRFFVYCCSLYIHAFSCTALLIGKDTSAGSSFSGLNSIVLSTALFCLAVAHFDYCNSLVKVESEQKTMILLIIIAIINNT